MVLSESDKIRMEVYGPEAFERIKLEEYMRDHKLSMRIRQDLGKEPRMPKGQKRGNPVVLRDQYGQVMKRFQDVAACAEAYGMKRNVLKSYVSSYRPEAVFRPEIGAWVQYVFDYEAGFGLMPKKNYRLKKRDY